MLEDITDPPKKESATKTSLGGWSYYPLPEDSVEASWNARLLSGFAFILVAVEAVGRHGHSDVALLLGDAGLLVLLALVWIFRSPVAAGILCATALFFAFGGPETSAQTTKGWWALAPFIGGLFAVRDCIRYQRFRKADEAPPPSPDSADSLSPS